MLPRARLSDVFAHDVGDELVVYDKPADRTHRLNRLAGLVWRLADGRRSVADIAAALRDPHGLVADEPIVELALLDLRCVGLLESDSEASPGMSRRELLVLIGKGALAAALLPFVATLSANALPDKCFKLTGPGGKKKTPEERNPDTLTDPECTTAVPPAPTPTPPDNEGEPEPE